MYETDRNTLRIPLAPSIEVLVGRWVDVLRDGGSFRPAATEAQTISVWISNHADTLSEWCRQHFIRDFRQVSGIVSHGADLERRMGLLERFESVLEGSAHRAAASRRHVARSEHEALLSLVRQFIAHRDGLSIVVSEHVSERQVEQRSRATMTQALASASIAARGFASDRSGWEALHMCVEKFLAAARLADDSDSCAAFARLSDSLLRCRAVARLHEDLHVDGDGSEGIGALRAAVNKILEMRFSDIEEALKHSRISGVNS